MINLSPSGSKNDPNTKLKIYDLENAAVKHAAVLRPNEFENKSRQIPKQKLAIRKVILLRDSSKGSLYISKLAFNSEGTGLPGGNFCLNGSTWRLFFQNL